MEKPLQTALHMLFGVNGAVVEGVGGIESCVRWGLARCTDSGEEENGFNGTCCNGPGVL